MLLTNELFQHLFDFTIESK